jgi:putative PIN family toxin of toxin-antitoxin system
MTRVVLDTNVFISAILNPHGSPGAILDQVFDQKVSLCLSPPLIDEIQRVIRYKKMMALLNRGGRNVEQAEEIIDKIVSVAEVSSGLKEVNLIAADPDDNMVLACALESEVDYIVSGDRHLTGLGDFQGIPILSPRDFLEAQTPKAPAENGAITEITDDE